MENTSIVRWRYVRLFAEQVTHKRAQQTGNMLLPNNREICPTAMFNNRNIKAFKCFASGSILAKVIGPDSFEMEIILATGYSYAIYLLNGFDHCLTPIGALSKMQAENETLLDCTAEMRFTQSDPPVPIVSFYLTVPSMTEHQKYNTSTTTGCGHNGVWLNNRWVSDNNCQLNESKDFLKDTVVCGL